MTKPLEQVRALAYNQDLQAVVDAYQEGYNDRAVVTGKEANWCDWQESFAESGASNYVAARNHAANPKTIKALITQLKAQAERIKALEGELDKAREALVPFANQANEYDVFRENDYLLIVTSNGLATNEGGSWCTIDCLDTAEFDLNDLHRASELLQQTGGDDE